MISRPADSVLAAAERHEPLLSAFARWRYRDPFLLGLLVGSITAFNLLWVALDSGRLYWDFARHLGDSIFYKDSFTLAHPIRYLEGYTRYPPFAYWVTDVFYAVFGNDIWVAILSNVVFIAILAFATYGIGKTLWSRRVGLLAATLAVTSPLFVSQFREYMLDAPLSAMVAAGLYFLIRSENFAHRRASVLFGVCCGLGLLIKWTLPFYLGLPALAAILGALVESRREQSQSRLVNIGGAALATAALSALWYIPHHSQFRQDIRYSTGLPASIQGDPPVGSLASWLWYFWSLVNNELYLIPFLFFVAGIVFVFRRDDAAAKSTPLILCMVGSYFAVSLIALKDFRYGMPMISSVAVVAVAWLEHVKPRARLWLSGGLVAYSVMAFFVISFGTGLLPKKIAIPLKARSYTSNLFDLAPPENVRVTGIVIFAQHGFRVGAPSGENWHQQDLFKEIVARSPNNRTFAYSGQPLETIWFTTWGLRYWALRYHALWLVPQQAQFLIVRGPVPSDITKGFVEIKQYVLPYDGPVRLYERAA